MDFHAVETGLNGATHSFPKLADHSFYFFGGQCNRRCGTVTRCGHRAWANRGTATNQFWVNHTAAVVDLQQRFRSFGFNRLCDFRQPGNFLVVINTDGAREGETEIVNEAALHDDGTDAAGASPVVLHQLTGDSTVIVAGTGGHRGH